MVLKVLWKFQSWPVLVHRVLFPEHQITSPWTSGTAFTKLFGLNFEASPRWLKVAGSGLKWLISPPSLPVFWPVFSGRNGVYMGKMGSICHCPRALSANIWGHCVPILVFLLAFGTHKRGATVTVFVLFFPASGYLGTPQTLQNKGKHKMTNRPPTCMGMYILKLYAAGLYTPPLLYACSTPRRVSTRWGWGCIKIWPPIVLACRSMSLPKIENVWLVSC